MSDYEIMVQAGDHPAPYTVLFGDIVGSTGIKETQTETSWVKGTMFLYSAVENAMSAALREVATRKYLGDGVMIAAPAMYAAEMVNTGIKLLEAISDARKGRAGGKGEIDYNITVGVATGDVREVAMPDGRRDFIGQVPDKASRLCSLATTKGLLVDVATVAAANMTLIRSRVGVALDRRVEEYLSPRDSAPLKGFAQKVDFHEIMWSDQFFGVKANNLTSSVARLEAATRPEPASPTPPAPPSPAAATAARFDRKVGTIKCWDRGRGFGFVTVDGEDFHICPQHVVYQEDLGKLVPGQRVAFVAGPATDSRKRPEALAVLLIGGYAQGFVTALPEGRPYGWIRVVDLAGNAHPMFMPRDGLADAVARGCVVDFRVKEGPRGAYAAEVTSEDKAA